MFAKNAGVRDLGPLMSLACEYANLGLGIFEILMGFGQTHTLSSLVLLLGLENDCWVETTSQLIHF